MEDIIMWIIFIVVGVLIKIVNIIYNAIQKKKINFDEFADVEKIKQQEINNKQEMEYESKVLQHVYRDTYNESLIRSSLYNSGISNYDRAKAVLDAEKAVERAEKDLYNFKVLDSVQVKKEDVLEAPVVSSLRENGINFDIELFKKWSRQIFGCIKLGNEEQLKIVKIL